MYLDPDLWPRTGSFESVAKIFATISQGMLRRPERMTVTEVAEKYVITKRPGARSGTWDHTKSPYMVEPQNLLSSRELAAIIFCGPAQSGKTESLILNWLAYKVIQDPMDMIIFSPTQVAARDFAVRRVDRMNASSPALRNRMINSRAYDNKGQKQYKSGMIVNLSWPTPSEMAGKPVPCIALTDYDRMEDEVGDEGSPFDLASARGLTFKRFAMTVAESSPSRPVEDVRWSPATPHEAPPTKGILSLYNRGDRRRLYWPCPSCFEYFEGKWKLLDWDHDEDNALDAADTVYMLCPHCNAHIVSEERPWMLENSVWLKDGQWIDKETGKIKGKGQRSKIASFWLNGVAAGFTTWENLVVEFINATQEYERNGSEGALQKFYNTSLGEPYYFKEQQLERLPETLQERAEKFPERQVPDGVRFLLACIDVQTRRFVVQVHGIGPGVPYDIIIVDRFEINKSNRVDDDGDHPWVRPGTYAEDWETILEQVMLKTYPLAVDPEKRMMIKLTVCDSGGEDGVTTNAYEFWRSLRRRGMSSRFHLVKGNPIISSPRAFIDYPDSKQKSRFAAARGDVPVMFLNSNMLKDALNHRLDVLLPGHGMIRFPDWLPDYVYKELCVEHRDEAGKWKGTRGVRNEAWDLLYYCLGVCASQLLRVETINWISPPPWAAVWQRNPLIISLTQDEYKVQALTPKVSSGTNFAELGKALA